MPSPSELQRELDAESTAERYALCGEIASLRATIESQAQKISILTAELAVMREQRLLDDRRWVDDMAGRGDPDQKPERCQACGWPKHSEEHGG